MLPQRTANLREREILRIVAGESQSIARRERGHCCCDRAAHQLHIARATGIDARVWRGKAIGLLPVLVTVMLIVHSLAESRLLIEIGFTLLVVFAIRTRSNRGQNQHLPGMATPA